MNDAYLADLSLELHRGNVAIWFGPDSSFGTDTLVSSLAIAPWTAIWNETIDRSFALLLRQEWEKDRNDRLKQRFIQEVPNRLESSLGTYYSLNEFCPIFYLNGNDTSYGSTPLREQRRARDEKVDQLSRLNGGILFVSGFRNPKNVVDRILDEFTSASDQLRIIIFDASQQMTEAIATHVGMKRSSVLSRLMCEPASLQSVLSRIAAYQSNSPPTEPSIKVGSQHIPLVGLLSAKLDPPLDQYFEIIQSNDIAPPGESEDLEVLRDSLVRGRTSVWRAFANNLQWSRNSRRVEEVVNRLTAMHNKGSSQVICINIVAERGSGLTTLLREIAFRTALSGSPTVVHRPENHHNDYDSLRLFLERIDAEASRRGSHRPVPTIVFDSIDSGEDAMENLRHFPKRLASDGRTALIVRGISVRSLHDADKSFRAEVGVTPARDKVEEVWLGDAALPASLTAGEIASLSNWATSNWQSIQKDSLISIIREWGGDWKGESNESPPLLICLYFILKGHLSASTELGHHLLHRITKLLQAQSMAISSANYSLLTSDQPLTGEQITLACNLLKRTFGSPTLDEHRLYLLNVQPPHDKYFDVLAVLSALGALRVGISRAALAKFCEIESDALIRILIDFDDADLTTADVTRSRKFLAPAAYYESADWVGLRHPAYGRLILEWLRSGDATSIVDSLPSGCMTRKILKAIRESGIGPYPIWLFTPLFESVGPSSAQVRFVEEVSTRFLRIQRLQGSAYHKWIYTPQASGVLNSELVYDVLEKVPEEVVRQRSGILHTRGITRYKSCWHWSLPIAECRRRYDQAWSDFDLAMLRTDSEMSGESPATILTSKGLSYMLRSQMERDRTDGDIGSANEIDAQALTCFRLALQHRRDNPYASYGLAQFLISSCERVFASQSIEKANEALSKAYAEQLAEACELLQIEPSESFRHDWERLWDRLSGLLGSKDADSAIEQLKRNGDEIGFALQALRILGGRIPTGPMSDDGEVDELREAEVVLNEATIGATIRSNLASLLRYAIYSSHPDRVKNVDFKTRYELVRKLKDTPYLRTPLWLFDYGMLALQRRDLNDGLQAFQELRKAGKFFEVPLERTTYLMKMDEPELREVGTIRIVRIDPDGKGWGNLDSPLGFDDSIPFSATEFKKQTANLQPGRTMTCYIRIRPSGPSAEPIER